MTSKEMHYDFKIKLNKIDSQQYRNFRVPEVDWLLNEAQEVFIKSIAAPRKVSHLGFERNRRSTEDLKNLVINSLEVPVINSIASLPEDYMFFVRARVNMIKGNCQAVSKHFNVEEHDDEFEESYFDKSSFEWRTVNAVFTSEGIKLYNDGSFTNDSLLLSYIKYPVYIHNAEDFRAGGYNTLNGENLIGTQDCELSEHTHREIVDIAVLLATNHLQSPDYQRKWQKLQINEFK